MQVKDRANVIVVLSPLDNCCLRPTDLWRSSHHSVACRGSHPSSLCHRPVSKFCRVVHHSDASCHGMPHIPRVQSKHLCCKKTVLTFNNYAVLGCCLNRVDADRDRVPTAALKAADVVGFCFALKFNFCLLGRRRTHDPSRVHPRRHEK